MMPAQYAKAGTKSQGNFYAAYGKRSFDLAVSAVALVLSVPVFLVCALLVKLSSRGPVFYKQQRVGLDGTTFNIIKFRSMRHDTGTGAEITVEGDKRITPIGAMLRKTKLDELPQLWNVLKGDMSLVGPRPEVARYVRFYTRRQRQVLSVSPGITDPASIRFLDEETLLASQPDPESFYLNSHLPAKLEINLHYIAQRSFIFDLRIIAKTLTRLFKRSGEKPATESPGIHG